MTSSVGDVGRDLVEAFGHMMPKSDAWRASQNLSHVAQDLAAIVRAMQSDIGSDFANMDRVADAVERILDAANSPQAANTRRHAQNAARLAGQVHTLLQELAEVSQRLNQITTGQGTVHGYSLPGSMHGYTVTRVDTVNAAANYCDVMRAPDWGQALRNMVAD